MKSLRYLVMAGALMLGASNIAAQQKEIPEFKRNYVADTKVEPLVTAKGPILWESKKYEVHNSPTRTIYELHGYINIPIKVFNAIGNKKSIFHLGAITRIDGDTIESIIYVNNRTNETLSEYDKMIAKREGINLDGICSLWHEKYTPNTITNLETGEVRPRNGAAEFQTIYFNMPEGDTLMNVNFCGDEYPINIKRSGSIMEADLTIPDPKKPGERKKLQWPLFNIRAHKDEYGIPDKIVAGVDIGIRFYPEAKHDSTKKWLDLK
ncbi:MAG: hypothetical protein ACP5NW_02085 [Candidatus Woesearchaeota archaeon]